MEKVLVADVNNGNRFETYIIKTVEKGIFCVNSMNRILSIASLVPDDVYLTGP